MSSTMERPVEAHEKLEHLLLERISGEFPGAAVAFKQSPYAGELLLEVQMGGCPFSEGASERLFAIAGDVEEESKVPVQIIPFWGR